MLTLLLEQISYLNVKELGRILSKFHRTYVLNDGVVTQVAVINCEIHYTATEQNVIVDQP